MFDIHRFKTLMLREWLQNRWTWLIVIAVLPALVLVTMPFGQLDFDNENPPERLVAAAALAITAMVCTLAAWATVLFMATGLARRDVQDRSIEFWMSLPSTHAEHIGAQYLMHALLFPLGALVAGLALGGLIAPLTMLKWQGLSGLAAVPWGEVLLWVGSTALLAAFSLVLAALWLSPLVLLLMAMSAWVKRLALPLLALAAVFLSNLPATREPVRGAAQDYAERVGQLLEGVVRAFVSHADLRLDDLQAMSASQHLSNSFANLASPTFVGAMVVAGLCAWLLALRRAKGG